MLKKGIRGEGFGMAEALEVFARGFGFARGLTHPYVAERVGVVWRMADGPRNRGD